MPVSTTYIIDTLSQLTKHDISKGSRKNNLYDIIDG